METLTKVIVFCYWCFLGFQRRTGLGFHPRTAYLCMTYFDRFISLRQIPVAMVRLLSVACLSLAAKMKEQNIPSLSQYEVENPHFFRRKTDSENGAYGVGSTGMEDEYDHTLLICGLLRLQVVPRISI